jgi:hypothetical protein
MIRRAMKIVVSAAVAAVFVIGVASLFAPAQAAGSCNCLDIYAPVICSNGVTYSNACVAGCNHAKNCRPAGGI